MNGKFGKLVTVVRYSNPEERTTIGPPFNAKLRRRSGALSSDLVFRWTRGQREKSYRMLTIRAEIERPVVPEGTGYRYDGYSERKSKFELVVKVLGTN